MAWAYEEYAQNPFRDVVEWLLPVTRRNIPRFRVQRKR